MNLKASSAQPSPPKEERESAPSASRFMGSKRELLRGILSPNLVGEVDPTFALTARAAVGKVLFPVRMGKSFRSTSLNPW
jgi:hypothetical protein